MERITPPLPPPSRGPWPGKQEADWREKAVCCLGAGMEVETRSSGVGSPGPKLLPGDTVASLVAHSRGKPTNRKDCDYGGGGKSQLRLEPWEAQEEAVCTGGAIRPTPTHPQGRSHLREQGREGQEPCTPVDSPSPEARPGAHRVQEGKRLQREELCTKHPPASFPNSKIPQGGL